jgi:hypothetical protein
LSRIGYLMKVFMSVLPAPSWCGENDRRIALVATGAAVSDRW